MGKNVIGMDKASERYIKNIKNELGIEGFEHIYEAVPFMIQQSFPLFWNSESNAMAYVGRAKGGRWVAQIGIYKKGQIYEENRYIFTKSPTAEEIMNANWLHRIEHYVREYSFVPVCRTCGGIFHWSNIRGDLSEQYKALIRRDCGGMHDI